ncbi:RNA ligase family protein [Heyndrickxia acidicola]|uniref:RNA ligase family protein n=1 Tax=Heyndrickxia acidicola TaxID=209389 RepID=A0ABU6MG61_9BACI|nr:RNA ligase family protein [Heyndrickxia acidicola]MED1203264.1 RNA ligase family protein [Heyndrickxia acidicola]
MFVSPMLLERGAEPFDSEDYITELKLDGIRLLLSKFDNKVRLYTRHNNEVTSLFPEIYKDLEIPDGTILDGELIVPGPNGGPDFEAVMERFKSARSTHFLQFCVFDIIYYKGEKVANWPLIQRKELLSKLNFQTEHVVLVQWVEGNAIAYFNAVKENSLEGIVQKRKDSRYEIDKRSDKWIKVINYHYLDVYITGILKRDNSYLLALDEHDPAIGVMESLPVTESKKIYDALQENIFEENDRVIRFKKGFPCNIKFRNWTSNGKLRVPSFHKWHT